LTTLQTVAQIPEDDIALITLHLTFGGTPGPFKWGVVSETVCDLANKLLRCEDWDTLILHLSVQQEIPTRQYLNDNVPFAEGRELIVDVPISHQGFADIYIDNTTGLTIDLPGTQNAERLEAAILLAIKVAARPHDKNESIPRKPMIARDKLKAERGLTEAKTILNWHFNFVTLTMTLPEHKYIVWSVKIQKMIYTNKTTKQDLESMIGRIGHIGFVVPWVYHFLSQLRTLLARACNRRTIKIDDKCAKDLVLMQQTLEFVCLNSTGNPVSGNQEFCLAPAETMVEQVNKIRSLT
jgi:hypothetical protein